ncbi:MAG: TolC family protein [Paludibacter sp.]|nr:TolC family protein [Paludibacter sp.]MDD4198838.1 TolC family protein [Paludibacter sp.]MDD4427414.1 TolC family protein [Paludibacter sp.]
MKYKGFVILLSLLVSNYTFSQESLSLTLQEAQQVALQHNRTLKNASIDVQKAEANRWQAIATMLPQINATVDYANMLGYKMELFGSSISMPPYANLGITTSLTFSAAQLIGIEMNKIAVDMTDISLKKTEQQISNQVKTIYYSVLVMEETVQLLEKNLINLNNLLVHTQQSVAVGVMEETDADQLMVQVASMETNINATKRSLEMLYNSMRLLLGIDVNTKITLTQTIKDLINIEKAMNLLGDEFVLDKNYNYQLLKQNIALSEKQVEIKKWAYAPTISAFHQYSGKYYFSDEKTMNMTPPNMVGISLNIPIFSSGNKYKALQEAKFEHNKQLNILEDTKESLLVQHSQLRYNLSSSYESYNTQKKNIEVTQRVFDNISRKYEHGMVSSLDVTNTGTNLISAQSSYVQSLMELVSAQIALEELLNIDNK